MSSGEQWVVSGKWGEPAARRDELHGGAPLNPRGIEHLARARARAGVRARFRPGLGLGLVHWPWGTSSRTRAASRCCASSVVRACS